MSTWANNIRHCEEQSNEAISAAKNSPPKIEEGVRHCERSEAISLRSGFILLVFIFSLLTLSSCKTTRLPKTTENSRPVKSSAYKKYTAKFGFEVDKSCNLKLLDEVMEWWGTPYKYGGESKSGADCSGFVQMVFLKVYDKKLPRTTKQQYEFCSKVNKSRLKEGDLVFFETGGKGISHVGIFLKDGRFAHASSSKGVIVNGLEEAYYDKAYRGGGRAE
jgi:cell wall-associated NlpC family hydrolase